MTDETHDGERRDFLMIATGAFLAVGGAFSLWPLVDQMNPDASAIALASTEVDLSPVQEGAAITVMWRGKPVFIRRRTQEEIAEAESVDLDALPDDDSRSAFAPGTPATDDNRTVDGKREWLVVVGVCTHLGCIPNGQRLGENRGEYNGWFCPCHGSHYDLSGRIRKGPAAENLAVPPYQFVEDERIVIG